MATGRSDLVIARLVDLPDSFKLSGEEQAELFVGISIETARLYRQVVFDEDKVYYLIPDLVHDRDRICLCKKCSKNPRDNKFSVASGHDYGRIGLLPPSGDVTLACITPARCFGLELSLSAKHSRGHAICFPSSGPHELNRVLPNIDSECTPRVTFIGPHEEWRVQRKNFRKLYTIDVDAAYEWLKVLSSVNNVFRDECIHVDGSTRRKAQLRELNRFVEANVHLADGAEVDAAHDEAGDVQELPGSTGSQLALVVQQSAVLPSVYRDDEAPVHEIVDALIATIAGTPTSRHSYETHRPSDVVPIKRGRSPFVEWVDNAQILAGVFPNLFLTGSSVLPAGPLPKDYIDHFMHYWDGRFEKSVMFVSMMVNQLQRHSAVQKAARVGATHTKTMESFGKLASTRQFQDALQSAKANPESPDSIRLNAALLRILSLVGGQVPFSPFERATTRPKLGAMRYKYGVAQHFVTIAPPEHDDLLLHRIAVLRSSNSWNDEQNVCSLKKCRFSDLPHRLQTSAQARLAVSVTFPALAAQSFERRMASLTRAIIRCRATSASRLSRSFFEHECGVYGRIAAFNAVVEPQTDGRLHAHISLYGASVNPGILTLLLPT